jgi:hypothetical protein
VSADVADAAGASSIGVDALVALVGQESGRVGIGFDGHEWVVALEWGHEAPDSPMAGAASYGVGVELRDALRQVLTEIAATS